MGLFLSLSTSAWLGLIGACGVLILSQRPARTLPIILGGVVVVWVLLSTSDVFRDAIDEKLVSRIDSWNLFLYHVPKDALVIRLLSQDMGLLLWGAGAGGTDAYTMMPEFILATPEIILRAGIIKVVSLGQVQNSLTPSSFAVKFLGEFGVIGVLLMLRFVIQALRRTDGTPYGRVSHLIALAVLGACLPSSMLLVYTFFIFLGVFYGISCNQREL